MSQDAFYDRECRECGSLVRRDAESCWLCGATLSGDDQEHPADVDHQAGQDARSHQFGVSTTSFSITFAAVWLGVTMLAPGLGIVLLILLAPAMARLVFVSKGRNACGEPLSIYEKLGVFGATVGLTLMVIGAVFVGLFVICMALLGGLSFR